MIKIFIEIKLSLKMYAHPFLKYRVPDRSLAPLSGHIEKILPDLASAAQKTPRELVFSQIE